MIPIPAIIPKPLVSFYSGSDSTEILSDSGIGLLLRQKLKLSSRRNSIDRQYVGP